MAQNPITLILGGARSGKSALALKAAIAAAASAQKPPAFIATAQALDDEMVQRIARHQAERSGNWLLREAALDIGPAIDALAPQAGAIVIDCLTLWLSNLMHHERDITPAARALIHAAQRAPCPIIMVSNEVGLGLVPDTPLGRAFRDEQGRLNQHVAQEANTVVFVAAGLPLVLKGAFSH